MKTKAQELIERICEAEQFMYDNHPSLADLAKRVSRVLKGTKVSGSGKSYTVSRGDEVLVLLTDRGESQVGLDPNLDTYETAKVLRILGRPWITRHAKFPAEFDWYRWPNKYDLKGT